MKLKVFAAFFILMVGLLFTFQNCMQTFSDKQNQNSQATSNVPFAFEMRPDLVGYNSCSNFTTGSFDKSQYFTFKVKAFSSPQNPSYAFTTTGGLKLSKDFKTFLSQYGTLSTTAEFNAAKASTLSQSAWPQLSVRNSTFDLVLPYGNTAGGIVRSTGQLQGSWSALTDDSVLNALVSSDIAGTPLATLGGTDFSLSVSYTDVDFENSSSGLIQSLDMTQSSSMFLTLGYNLMSSDDRIAMISPTPTPSASTGSPSGTTNRLAYGQQFQFQFSPPYYSEAVPMPRPNRVLANISERNTIYTTYPAVPGWSCHGFRTQFKVAPRDAGLSQAMGCGNPSDPNVINSYLTLSSSDRQFFDMANSLLNDGTPNARWIIDMASKCIYPSTGLATACYNNLTLSSPVAQDSDDCGGTGQKVCPHYFSFCAYKRPL